MFWIKIQLRFRKKWKHKFQCCYNMQKEMKEGKKEKRKKERRLSLKQQHKNNSLKVQRQPSQRRHQSHPSIQMLFLLCKKPIIWAQNNWMKDMPNNLNIGRKMVKWEVIVLNQATMILHQTSQNQKIMEKQSKKNKWMRQKKIHKV